MKSPIFRAAAGTVAAGDSSGTSSSVRPNPRVRPILAALLAGAFAVSDLAFAAGPPLALAEAQRLAVERSRRLPAQDAASAASREMALAAGRLPDPVLKLGIDNLPVDGPDRFSLTSDFMTMRRIGLMQEFTRAEKRQWRALRFEREAEKSLVEKSASLAAIQRDTALAWLDIHYAETQAAVIARQTAEARLATLVSESAYRAGRGNQADVFAAHSALAAIEDQAAEGERRVRGARNELARWVGDAAGMPLGEKPAIDSLRMDPATLDAQLAHHPEIAALAKQQEIAAADAEIARADRKSDWSMEILFSQRGPAYSNMVSVGISIPLQWDQKRRQDRELASKLALLRQAEEEREEALRAHGAEVRAMRVEWESGRARLARYEREIIPLAGERTRASLAAYQGGKGNLTDLLLARRDEIETRLQAVQLEREIARLWAQLNFLVPDRDATVHAGAAVPRRREESK